MVLDKSLGIFILYFQFGFLLLCICSLIFACHSENTCFLYYTDSDNSSWLCSSSVLLPQQFHTLEETHWCMNATDTSPNLSQVFSHVQKLLLQPENFTWILLNTILGTFFSKQMKLISTIILPVWTLLRETPQWLLAFQCNQINCCKGAGEGGRKFAFFLIAKY